MPYREFTDLLQGLGAETPLAYIVGIRAEQSPKTIRDYTAAQKHIRSDWAKFQSTQEAKKSEQEYTDMFSNLSKMLAKEFGG